MRVAVTGGRSLNDRDLVFSTLDGLHSIKPITMLITGGCPPTKIGDRWFVSADSHAEEWAGYREVDNMIRRAKWSTLGKPAGPRRNERMMRDRPELLVAFPGGSGTADTVRRANKHGIEVRRVQQGKKKNARS